MEKGSLGCRTSWEVIEILLIPKKYFYAIVNDGFELYKYSYMLMNIFCSQRAIKIAL